MNQAGLSGNVLHQMLAWRVLDVAGLVVFIAGVMWFVSRWQIFGSLPADPGSAVALAVAGGVAMLAAATGIIRTVTRRSTSNPDATGSK